MNSTPNTVAATLAPFASHGARKRARRAPKQRATVAPSPILRALVSRFTATRYELTPGDFPIGMECARRAWDATRDAEEYAERASAPDAPIIADNFITCTPAEVRTFFDSIVIPGNPRAAVSDWLKDAEDDERADVERLARILGVTPTEASRAWIAYSEEYFAGWIAPPDSDDEFARMARPFLRA